MFSRGKGGSSRWIGRVVLGGSAAMAFGLFVVAPVVGDGLNSEPDPAPRVISATHSATSVQVAGTRGLASASKTRASRKKTKKRRPRVVFRKVTVRSRITDKEILTEEGKGTFVGIKCPARSRAISGGVLTRYINLLVSSSSPNHPLTRKYTPNIWWLTVTNVNVDGNGGTLPWQGVVNCISPARVGTG